AEPVSVDEELNRTIPVIKRLAAEVDVPISIDTRHHEVAGAALDAGAAIVNDVTAGTDPDMLPMVREAGAGVVLMHMRGDPSTMQQLTEYGDVVGEVRDYLAERLQAAVGTGIPIQYLAVDPGLGFAKTTPQSLSLMGEVTQ